MLRLEAMPRLEDDLAVIRADLARERQGRIEAEQLAAVLAAQKSDLAGRLADAKADIERVSQQLDKVQARAEQQAEALADARVSIQTYLAREKDLAVQIDTVRKDAEQARAAAQVAGEEAAQLRGKFDAVAKPKAG
mgnify:FL=1